MNKSQYKIISRYGQPRVVTQIDTNKYTIDGPSSYFRGGADNDGNPFIDYDGCPFVCAGDSMSFYGGKASEEIATVKAIEPSQEGHLTVEITTQSIRKGLKNEQK